METTNFEDVQDAPPAGSNGHRVALTRDAILGATDIETRSVEVPEWGGYVLVRGLTGRERDSFEQSLIETKGRNQKANLTNLRGKLVQLSVVNDAGAKVFSREDVDALSKKSTKALQRIVDVAQELSGLSEDDVEELTAVLGEDPSADSGSA